MTILSTEKLRSGRFQFQLLFPSVIEYEAVWDPASVLSNGETHENITVPGAELGDIVLVSVDVDVADVDIVAHVTASDTVTVGVHNPTSGAVDLGQLNLHIFVLQPEHSH